MNCGGCNGLGITLAGATCSQCQGSCVEPRADSGKARGVDPADFGEWEKARKDHIASNWTGPSGPVAGPGASRGTVHAHERTLPSGKVVKVRQHRRTVDSVRPDESAPAPPPAAAPSAAPPRPKLVRPAPGTPGAARPPLKPKPAAKPRARPAARPEPTARPKRKRRGPLVSRAHAAKLGRRAFRLAQRRHKRGKAVAYGALAIGELGAVAGLQGVGLALATVAAVAGVIATLAFKGSS